VRGLIVEELTEERTAPKKGGSQAEVRGFEVAEPESFEVVELMVAGPESFETGPVGVAVWFEEA